MNSSVLEQIAGYTSRAATEDAQRVILRLCHWSHGLSFLVFQTNARLDAGSKANKLFGLRYGNGFTGTEVLEYVEFEETLKGGDHKAPGCY